MPATPTRDPRWLLAEHGFNLAREHEIESLFAVANGRVGTQGSLAEGSSLSAPATFIAGVYRLHPHSGALPELAVGPDWMRLSAEVDGRRLSLEEGEILEHHRTLDLRQGILWREWRHRDPDGRITRIRGLRLASLADRHVLLQSVAMTPENYGGRIRMETRIERPVPEEDTARTDFHPVPRAGPAAGTGEPTPGGVALLLRTAGSGILVAFASASRLYPPEGPPVEPQVLLEGDQLVERWEGEVEIGRVYHLDRIVTVCSSRETERPAAAATAHLRRTSDQGMRNAVRAHTRAWRERWRTTDVEIAGDADAERALRFACYHLISAANPEDDRVSVAARSLTGGAYKGHIFWDTEIYMVPFYTFTHPPSARALLCYRHHTLPAARDKARRLGYRGALYPWESAAGGRESTPPFVLAPDGMVMEIRNATQENHISADVAYAVWQYWCATGDDDFFRDAGAEILLETARFWASRVEEGADDRFHIRHIIGPDEYHEDVDDNAYTNLMARWNLERGVDAVRTLGERWPEHWRKLRIRLELGDEEPERWQTVAERMYTGARPHTPLIEQFRGYLDLEDIDLTAYEPRTTPMDILLGRERTQHSQVIKQADVVLLLHLLWDRFPPEVREANFRYYEPRCGHGSSLSPSTHALVAARLGHLDLALRYFRQAAEIDLANNMGNAAGGVHIGALGGLWQATVFGFAGMHLRADGLGFAPHVPAAWGTLRFPVQWRGRRLRGTAEADPPALEARLETGAPMTVAVEPGPETVVPPGRAVRTEHTPDGWRPWRPVNA